MMIKKLRTNILFSTKHNIIYKNMSIKTSVKNKVLFSNLLYLGKKKFGRLGFRRKLIWRFFFRKQVTKHYFRFRKYRFRFFKSKKFNYLLNKPYKFKSELKTSYLMFRSYNLFNFIPRNNLFTILNNQQDYLISKGLSYNISDNNVQSHLLLLKKKFPLKKTILNFFNIYNLYNILYKFYNLKKNDIFLKTNFKNNFFKNFSILLLLNNEKVK